MQEMHPTTSRANFPAQMPPAGSIALNQPVERVYRVGTLELDIDRRQLSGPRGAVQIAPVLFAIMERLMRRPAVVVEHSSMISAIWPNPDDEPDEPMATIKDKIKNLRGAINVLGSYGPDGVEIRCEREVGYFLRTRFRRS